MIHLNHKGKPKNTGVGNLSLLQQIFPTQESKQGLLHCRQYKACIRYHGYTMKEDIGSRDYGKGREKIFFKEGSVWADEINMAKEPLNLDNLAASGSWKLDWLHLTSWDSFKKIVILGSKPQSSDSVNLGWRVRVSFEQPLLVILMYQSYWQALGKHWGYKFKFTF